MKSIAEEMASTCLMMRTRLVARAITTLYEEELRPLGIKGSQLNLLAAVACAGSIRRGEIGKVLHIDPSTLTRNLKIMEANGWITEAVEGSDGRGSPVRVTPRGEVLLVKSAPLWKIAQRRASRLLGSDGKAALLKLSDDLPGAPA